MFNFKPMSEEEIVKMEEEKRMALLIQPGVYKFFIDSCEQKRSKAGNQMIEIVALVQDQNGKSRKVYDYLVDTMHYKIRHFFHAIGMGEDYQTGCVNTEKCVGKIGYADIGIRPPKDGYPEKNFIKDYMPKVNSIEQKTEELPFNDDVPF